MKTKLSSATELPWVLHFDRGPMDNLEIRKLPAFTSDINVSFISSSCICKRFRIVASQSY